MEKQYTFDINFGIMVLNGINVEVEASTAEEAERKAEEMLANGDFYEDIISAIDNADIETTLISENTMKLS